MSEYQYIHFAAVDQPLNDKQLAYMQAQSTRAEVTRWSFENEYHYSDFRGNELEMMRRGYDVHLHYANFGIRKLMFRLPFGLPITEKQFDAYAMELCIEWTKDKRGKGGVLSFQADADSDFYCGQYFEFDHLTAQLPKIRKALMVGDTRAFYLGWLAFNWNEVDLEPPVPAGLKRLPPELAEFADFYEIDVDLLAAASTQSSDAPNRPGDEEASFDAWLSEQSRGDLQKLMRRVLDGDAVAVRAESLAAIRNASGMETWPTTEGTRTLAEIREQASKKSDQRKKRELAAEQRKLDKRLAKFREDPSAVISEAGKLIQERSTTSYHQAAKLLSELGDAIGGEKGERLANEAAMRIVKKHPTLHRVKRAFKNEGLNYK
ncbi:hypothetical protein [Rhodopirellula sp. MGV]|uniref:hypothetical protein n=1 Tax=Rhodopirellula sp. MGV TaxID=2023130 RepID=UPI000B95F4E3|nr:hypothetical protein [Rhodopirellula sp. MGV]OYP37232.1 hypothetical protein CGZ80_05960 [Rhodopirellula sp. MGV]PNY34150.1 hypothetical protein C2E31_24965 [Rhodopirellula baltica]